MKVDSNRTGLTPEPPGIEVPSRSPAESLDTAMSAVTRMDEQELRSALVRARSVCGSTDLVEGVVGPFARELGAQWTRGGVEAFQEHVATVEIRWLPIRIAESASTRKEDGLLSKPDQDTLFVQYLSKIILNTLLTRAVIVLYIGKH
jgi:hypothetical protein